MKFGKWLKQQPSRILEEHNNEPMKETSCLMYSGRMMEWSAWGQFGSCSGQNWWNERFKGLCVCTHSWQAISQWDQACGTMVNLGREFSFHIVCNLEIDRKLCNDTNLYQFWYDLTNFWSNSINIWYDRIKYFIENIKFWSYHSVTYFICMSSLYNLINMTYNYIYLTFVVRRFFLL